MKSTAVLFLILFINSCSRFESENNNAFTTTNSELNQNNSLKDIIRKNEIKNEIQAIENEKIKLKKEITELSKASRLSNLETAKISKNDLEVRIRKQSAWWKAWILILKRTDNKWSAEYQKQTFYDGTLKLKSASKSKLNEPKSGWENLWKKLTDEELLTLPDGLQNRGFDPCPDCDGLLVETNIGGKYRNYIYTQPTLQSSLRETRQIAKISNIVAGEFDLTDFFTENSNE